MNTGIIEQAKKFKVRAIILVPPFHGYYFHLSINGWSVTPTSGGTEYTREFNYDSDRKDWLNSIEDLRFILLACFLDDLAPRIIHSFKIEGLKDKESLMKAVFVFGNSQDNNLTIEDKAIQSFYFSGELFNGQYNNNPHYQPNIELIQEWFEFFKENKYIATNLSLIQESFILFNSYFNKLTFYETVTLLNGVILLVSGLEGIFLQNQNEFSDLTFKFSLIGSIFYQKYANEEFLRRFEDNQRKFTQQEFREILKELYYIRSYIAHGDYKKLYNCKTWKKFLNLKNVASDENDLPMTLKNVALALGLLEKHIFAIIIGAKKDLLRGIKIINDISFS